MNLIRQAVKKTAYRLVREKLHRPFEHVSGYCWRTKLNRFPTEATEYGSLPRILVFEGDEYLGNHFDSPEFVREYGYGSFHVEAPYLYFSTSDNSSPNENGRTYYISQSEWLFKRRTSVNAPVNYRRQNLSEEAIAEEVDQAMASARNTFAIVEEHFGRDLQGRSFLEIGPGHNYKSVLPLSCLGAELFVVDSYQPSWDDDYHARYFSGLADAMQIEWPELDLSPIRELISARDFASCFADRFATPMEKFNDTANQFDFAWSSSVGEHFYDPKKSFENLFTILKPGGISWHAIDCRDHRDFSRPLEYLKMSEDAFWNEFVLRNFEMGNRWRPCEFRQLFEDIGFETLEFQTASEVTPEYKRETEAAIDQFPVQRFRNISLDDLIQTSCIVTLKKPTS